MTHNKITMEEAVIASQSGSERMYWSKRLSGTLEESCFPYDFDKKLLGFKTTENNREFESVKFKITGNLFSRMMWISNDSDVRLHMVLVSLLVSLLYKYNFDKDKKFIIGTPIYKQDVEGDFVNTILPLRNHFEDRMTFKECLFQVKQTIEEAVNNQNYPLKAILSELKISFDESSDHFPLFDTAVLLTNIQSRDYIRHIKLKMIFSFLRTGECIEGTVEYDSSVYEKAAIERITSHFINLSKKALFDVDVQVSRINILSEEEKRQLLFDFNETHAQFPDCKTVHRLFEEQVERTPDHIAVTGSSINKGHDVSLTYRELNGRANRLARLLKRKGVKQRTIAAIIMDHSVELVSGLLAILKAGGAYLPIDPDIPDSRVLAILEDAQPQIVLTETGVFGKHSLTAWLCLHSIRIQTYLTEPREQIRDFNSLPIPDRSFIHYEKYNRYIGLAMVKNTVSLQGTRGCPYNCAYCHKIWPKNHVIRRAENIFAEVQFYYNLGVRRFVIVDDIFNLNEENGTEFFRLIIDNGLDIQLYFPNGMRGDILTRKYIDLMVEAGTVSIAFALETASPRLQRMIRKNLNLKKLRENLEYFCDKYPHIILELSTMHGFPTETEDEALMTLDFIKEIKWLHFPYVHILKIYPNTDMEKLALENGISKEAIFRSADLAFHELPETLPFDRSFSLTFQTDFLNEYFLSKERLLQVLPHQMRVLTEDEILQKYDSYLPTRIDDFDDLLQLGGITRDELSAHEFLAEERVSVSDLDEKIRSLLPAKKHDDHAFRILFLDLSQFFSHESDILYNVVEPPLGLMYVMTYLSQQFGSKMKGKVAKSRIDFDNYSELKEMLDEFRPDLIGIRTLTFYKDFFHKTVSIIRLWGIDVPIIAGGPYATSDYETLLQDRNINLAVLSEGEITACELIQKIMENGGKLPDERVLREIPGIAFIPRSSSSARNFSREVLMIDAFDEPMDEKTSENPGHTNLPEDLAYIIFTSGSTGKPKGVMIEHRNVVRLMCNEKFPFDFNDRDVWTLFHSYGFDFSVWEMYGALLYGGRLIIIPRMVARDTKMFLRVLKKEKVTVLNQTPTAFYHLMEEESAIPGRELSLKYIIFGGEALKPIKLKAWQERYPESQLINMYGITETTVHVSYKEITDKEIERNQGNIGKPIPTLRTYVMDKNLRLLPIRVPGELYVGGAGVGRGYLNRPELTGVKFVENPYKACERLYSSGDLVKLLFTGEMEYSGRLDQQVKIRGYRIELAEIENRLLKHNNIQESIVLAKEYDNREKYLCAYIVTAGKEFEAAEYREYLSNYLPDYMIPSYFIQIDKLLLTPNGKVDWKELPAPGIKVGKKYIPPGNEDEEKLVEIWSEVLGIDKTVIGINDNFFDLGGNSLKVMQVNSKLRKAYKRDIPIVKMFKHTTIGSFASYLSQEQTQAVILNKGRFEAMSKGRSKLKNLKHRIGER